MDIQRLRNLTTGRLHTDIGCIYEDIEYLTGMEGIMTHMLPRACTCLMPYLKEKVTDERFWDGEYDTTHVGTFDIEPLNAEQVEDFQNRYMELPDPLEGKPVIGVVV